ncbi:MAG: DUF2752 domain-containing protein [Desulfobacterales bacterium]|nr:MAG: DUF2752 domain-containing protein [Desulfobacterales bacterium]
MSIKASAAVNSRLTGWLFAPVLAPLLEHQIVIRILAAGAVLQVGAVAGGRPGWPCPLKAILGVPCPGCGLSTATALFIQGRWQAAVHVHAFAPVLFVLIFLLAVGSLMSPTYHQQTLRRLEHLEQRTGLGAVLILGFVGYWFWRLKGV